MEIRLLICKISNIENGISCYSDYGLSVLFLVGYELYCFLIKYAKKSRNHQ